MQSTIARLSRVQWAKQWGWQMFNLNVATAAVAIVISSVPYQFKGQHAIASVWFIIDLVLFTLNVTMTVIRVAKHPDVFRQSFFDRSEATWFPVVVFALQTIIINILLLGVPYAGHWLIVACEVLYWISVFLACVVALVMQSTFRTLPRPIAEIGPPDCLEVYPLMFGGVVGATLVTDLVKIDPQRALTVMLFAYFFQGIGFFIGMLKLSVWMAHDMTHGKASAEVIPSYLIAVGVPGFTSYTLVKLSHATYSVFIPNDFLSGMSSSLAVPTLAADVFSIASIWFSLLLIGMSAWFLLIYLGWGIFSALFEPRKSLVSRWKFTWWSWIFPLTGVVVTFSLYAEYFPSKAFGVLNIVCVFFMAIMWLINALGTLRMFWQGSLPGTAEPFDRHELKRRPGEEKALPGSESGVNR